MIRLPYFRHAGATLLLADGIPVRAVSERLGPASATTTLTIYHRQVAVRVRRGDAAQPGRELLVGDQQCITQISSAVGYRSTSHFLNEFRDRFGVTRRAFSAALAGRELPPVAGVQPA